MFYYLKGKITVIEQNLAVVDCGGIGFQCVVSMNTLSHLELGQDVTLYTYCNIREDGVDVFGFYELSEKRSFEMLLGVSGVGPKAAISILSSVTPEGLALAVLNHDEKMITAAQGVGKNEYQRDDELKAAVFTDHVEIFKQKSTHTIPPSLRSSVRSSVRQAYENREKHPAACYFFTIAINSSSILTGARCMPGKFSGMSGLPVLSVRITTASALYCVSRT